MKNTNHQTFINKGKVDFDGLVLLEKIQFSVVHNHTKRYYNCLFTLLGLEGCQRDLLDFLCEEMDSDNVVHSNTTTKKKFIKMVSSATKGEKVYADSTIRKAFNVLKDKHVLMAVNHGSYRVNPHHFFRSDNKKKRLDLIIQFERDKQTKVITTENE